MNKLDISLMYVTDDRILDNERFFEVLNAALAGGATIIQLREKSIDTKSFIERAPNDIVEQEKSNFINLEKDVNKLNYTLESL